MVTGLKMALLSPNGTGVCAQAGTVMSIVDYVEKQQKNVCNYGNPVFCFFTCVYLVFRQMLESLCSFSVVAVGVHGGAFIATSKRAKQTLGAERAGRFLVIDSNLTWLLRLQAHTLSTVIGILALVAVDATEELGIFKSIISGVSKAGETDPLFAQWLVVLVVVVFFFILQRPLITLSAVICLYIFRGKQQKDTMLNAGLAALIVGSTCSLIFHQFAEAAKGSLDALVYCYSLDEASGFEPLGSAYAQRQHVADLSQKMMDLQALHQPSAPLLDYPGPTNQVAMAAPMQVPVQGRPANAV